MEFTNVLFLFLVLPLFLITYKLVPQNFKNFAILTFSFVMVGCSFLNYFAASLINKAKKKKARMFLIFFSTLVNFAICFVVIFRCEFYFYSNFFRGNIFKNLFIYIYFMNSISYLIDIYKSRVNFSKNIVDYFLYVFMFFKFFLGPVVPYHKIKNYIEKRNVEFKYVVFGVEQFIFGLFKVAVFSYETGQIVRFVVLKTFEELSFCAAWMGAAAMFFNIYFYFFGYCDMANGLGRIVGFSFPKNFGDKIFFSSLTKFFKNFNITFTNYFKFYVFPWSLEKGKIFRFFKYLIVMVLYIISFEQFYSIVYFFSFIFIENVLLGKILKKVPVEIKKIISFILILIGVSIVFQNSGLEISKYFKFLFGGSGIFFDRSLVFIITFLRFFAVILLYFVFKALVEFLNKPKDKYENVYIFLKHMLFLTMFLVSIAYCLTV